MNNNEIHQEVQKETGLNEGDLDEFKITLMRKLVQKIEYELEKSIVPLGPYQIQEYFRAEREALDFLTTLSYEEQLNQKEEDWPFLAASLGYDTDVYDITLESLLDVAENIADKAKQQNLIMTERRKDRKDVSQKIKSAGSSKEAAKHYVKYLPKYNERLRNDDRVSH